MKLRVQIPVITFLLARSSGPPPDLTDIIMREREDVNNFLRSSLLHLNLTVWVEPTEQETVPATALPSPHPPSS